MEDRRGALTGAVPRARLPEQPDEAPDPGEPPTGPADGTATHGTDAEGPGGTSPDAPPDASVAGSAEPTAGAAAPDPGTPDPAEAATDDAGHGDAPDAAQVRLDASAHDHLLSGPLPAGSTRETAVLYDDALARAARPAEAGAEPGSDAGAAPVGEGRPDVVGVVPAVPTTSASRGHRHRRRRTRVAVIGLAVLVVGLAGLSTYLWVSASEWRDQAGGYLRTAQRLGDDVATARTQLAGSQAELEAVRAQLATAHERIVELADEKNQALDDWEITQQLVDYQQRVSRAAGGVALALDKCVQGQQELIGYLQQQADPTMSTPPYDPQQLAQFETDVELLCQEASEANISLQLELAR